MVEAEFSRRAGNQSVLEIIPYSYCDHYWDAVLFAVGTQVGGAVVWGEGGGDLSPKCMH